MRPCHKKPEKNALQSYGSDFQYLIPAEDFIVPAGRGDHFFVFPKLYII